MRILVAAILVAAMLAGCTGGSETPREDGPPVEVDARTGGVRGVVVDQALRPIAGATVTVIGTGSSVVTAEDGIFSIGRLPPGPAAIEVKHVLYSTATIPTIVEAGEAEPDVLRIELKRLIAQDPYTMTLAFDGFLTCSIGTPVFASEECGSGVGVPCGVPAVGCQRVGGQADNAAQFDFFVDGQMPRTVLVEQVWEPTSPEGERFYTILATNWTCDPSCGGNTLGQEHSGSPLVIRYEIRNGTVGREEWTPELQFSTFTWADEGVALNQKFRIFVTISYVLPLPEGWSFVAGDANPFPRQ
ncbi:MAG TPA: carboxypeptidase-like regulatory domain-containing protein [Candidatus Thermoplasmatota archaeon]|nr:carboxypeptidase-like regulatory domain-containing protein [Candidatus Thermoplasmatota archaeon]